jgi:hypothetical protein
MPVTSKKLANEQSSETMSSVFQHTLSVSFLLVGGMKNDTYNQRMTSSASV